MVHMCDSSLLPCSTALLALRSMNFMEHHASHTTTHPHVDSLTGAWNSIVFSALHNLVGQSIMGCCHLNDVTEFLLIISFCAPLVPQRTAVELAKDKLL